MLPLIILAVCILASLVILVIVAARALTPKDIYLDRNSPSMAPLMRCRHCDEIISRDNKDEHGANCPRKQTAL